MPVVSYIVETVHDTIVPQFVRGRLKSIAEPPSKVVLRHADRILDSLMLVMARKLARSGQQLKEYILAGKRIVDESCEWPEMLSFCAPPTLKEMRLEEEAERRKMREPWKERVPILQKEINGRDYAWDFPLSRLEQDDRDYKEVVDSFHTRENEVEELRIQLARRREPSALVTNAWVPRILDRVVQRTRVEESARRLHRQQRLENGTRVQRPR